jgi:hypothetical protein
MLPQNESQIDRIVRLVVGLGLLTLLGIGPVPGWGLVGLLGFVLIGTSAMGYCPIYQVIGVSTRSDDKA